MVVVMGLSGGRRQLQWLWQWQWVEGKMCGGVGDSGSQRNNRIKQHKKEKKETINS